MSDTRSAPVEHDSDSARHASSAIGSSPIDAAEKLEGRAIKPRAGALSFYKLWQSRSGPLAASPRPTPSRS
jgi:hypothetical protein